MNDAVRLSTDGLLTTAQMAARGDFTLGLAVVCPSTRSIAGPGGTADVEPRVMQVLVVLADAAGQVVTRDTLFNRCWGGVYVGDDSLNRAIAAVRRLSAEIAGGSFEIETIPRTGYRLIGATAQAVSGKLSAPGMPVPRGYTRRELAGGALGLVALGGIGTWAAVNSLDDRRFEALMARGEQALHGGSPMPPAIRLFEQAVALRPGAAKAWGLLALTRSYFIQAAAPEDSVRSVDSAQSAARNALAIDPNEPNALLAMFELQGSTLDWITRDQRLRRIIAIDPANTGAISELVLMLQATGLSRESWNWNERALALEPLSFDFLTKRAMKLWIFGRISEADKVIDQVRTLYPSNPWPLFVQFMIFALTGRPRAAQAMLDPRPELADSPEELAIWRTGLAAFEQPSPQAIARARSACFGGARGSGGLAGQGVMILSALGDVDAAFDIANGFLLSRGAIVRSGERLPKVQMPDSRINTQWLFTPPCAALRADARFLPLCDAMGLSDYWRQRGVKPDFLRRRA